MIRDLIGFIITGLIVGALGRLAIPGRNPMGIGMTILLGIAGALAGGFISRAVLGGAFPFLIAVACAAGLVYLVSGGSRRGVLGGGRRGALGGRRRGLL